MIATTELINAYNMPASGIDTFLDLLVAQKISMFIFRLNAFSEWSSGPSATGIAKAKEMIAAANARGIGVAIDLHTWFTTWDNNFRDAASGRAANRATYINYVKNVLTAFAGSNVYAFMVMNEPQARTASDSENNFILDVIDAAKTVTNKPVSVRFMGGYSPSTGHYSSEIDDVADFLCRNTFWDARNKTASVYGVTEQKLLDAIAAAHDGGKELWITEFGANKSNPENQRSYVAEFVAWAYANGVDVVSLWVSQPTSNSESYNIFSGYTPFPAFYELISEAVHECPAGYHWDETTQTCVPDMPPLVWTLDIHHSGMGQTDPPTGIAYEYGLTESAVVLAIPAEGWVLDHWELDGRLPGATTLQVVVVPQEAGSAHHLMCLFKESPPECPAGYHWDETAQACVPDKPPCIIAFLLTAAGLSTALPFLRQFRSKLPKETVNGYYGLSKILMKGVRWCDLI